jgi:hypothetical protein
MKKTCTLIIGLMLASILSSCVPPQTTAKCKSKCDDAFLEDFVIWDTILGAYVHKNKCYDKCE